jgi:hypothetical protein
LHSSIRRLLVIAGALATAVLSPLYETATASGGLVYLSPPEQCFVLLGILVILVGPLWVTYPWLGGRPWARMSTWVIWGGLVTRSLQLSVISRIASQSYRTLGWVLVAATMAAVIARRRPVLHQVLLFAGLLTVPAVVVASASAGTYVDGRPQTQTAKNGQTVVVVILDELSRLPIIDEGGRLNPFVVPQLAALAASGMDFANAVTNDGSTTESLRTLLSGRLSSAPTSASDGQLAGNLVTDVLARGYRVRFFSRMVACPDTRVQCEAPLGRSFVERATAACVLTFYRLTPGIVSSRIPPIGAIPTWLEARLLRAVGQTAEPGSLTFVHVLATHEPYLVTGDGRPNWSGQIRFQPGGNHVRVLEQYRRQIHFADAAVGTLVAELKKRGVFEASTVVVTADHGTCWQVGCEGRSSAIEAIVPSLYRIPLIVKAALGRHGTVEVPYQHLDFRGLMQAQLNGSLDLFMASLNTQRNRIFETGRLRVALPANADLTSPGGLEQTGGR